MGKHHRGRQHACKHNGEPVQIPITPTPDPGQLPQEFNVWMAGSGGGHWTTVSNIYWRK